MKNAAPKGGDSSEGVSLYVTIESNECLRTRWTRRGDRERSRVGGDSNLSRTTHRFRGGLLAVGGLPFFAEPKVLTCLLLHVAEEPFDAVAT